MRAAHGRCSPAACVVLGLGPTLVAAGARRALAGPLVGAEPAGARRRAHRADLRRVCRPLHGRHRRRSSAPRCSPRWSRCGSSGASRRTRRLRDLGLRTDAPDRAHGVHRDGVRESLQARLRLLLPAREASGHRVPPRLPLLRRADRVREPDPLALRGVALPARRWPRSRRVAAVTRRRAVGQRRTRTSPTSWPRCSLLLVLA